MTDTQTIITMAVLFAGIVYVTAMYIYRKATAGETFNLESYAQTFGYVAIVAVVAYITTGVLPDFNALLTQILASFPDSGTVLAGVSTIIIYLFHQGTKSVSATSTTNAAATTASTRTPQQRLHQRPPHQRLPQQAPRHLTPGLLSPRLPSP